MITKLFHFLVLFVGVFTSLVGQVNWVLEPEIPHSIVDYKPESCPQFVEVVHKGKEAICNIDGSYFVEPGILKDIFITQYGYILAKDYHGKSVFINRKGEFLSDKYEYISSDAGTYLKVVRNSGKYGVINIDGEVIISLKYKLIKLIGNSGGVHECFNFDGSKEYKFLDIEFPWLEKKNSWKSRHRLKDRIVYSKTYWKDNISYIGINNMEGDTILRPNKYPYRGSRFAFESGLIIVKDKNTKKNGVVNETGEVVIPFKYDWLYLSAYYKSPTVFYGKIDDEFVLFNRFNEELARTTARSIEEVEQTGLYISGLEEGGKLLLNANFDPIDGVYFYDIDDIYGTHLFKTKSKSKIKNRSIYKYGIYDSNKKQYIDPIYDDITSSKIPEIIKVKIAKKYGYINIQSLDLVIDTIYNNLEIVNDFIKGEIYKTSSTNVRDTIYHILNDAGDVLLETKNQIKIGENGIVCEKTSDYDRIIHSLYERKKEKIDISDYFSFNTKTIRLGNNTYIFTSEYFLPNRKEYEKLSGYAEFISFKENDKYGLLDAEKKVVIPPLFDNIQRVYNKELYAVKFEGEWGLIKLNNE